MQEKTHGATMFNQMQIKSKQLKRTLGKLKELKQIQRNFKWLWIAIAKNSADLQNPKEFWEMV